MFITRNKNQSLSEGQQSLWSSWKYHSCYKSWTQLLKWFLKLMKGSAKVVWISVTTIKISSFALLQIAAHYIFVEKGLALPCLVGYYKALCMYICLLYTYNLKKMYRWWLENKCICVSSFGMIIIIMTLLSQPFLSA